MNKFCCDKFKSRADLENQEGLNIRIIKFGTEELIDKKNKYRFFITPGYKEEDKNVPTLNIAFCPFCGQNLFEFYKSDEYINETNSGFLYL